MAQPYNTLQATFTLEDLRRVQHLRLHEAAAAFNMGATQFKKLCRDIGVTRWPQRKVSVTTNVIRMRTSYKQAFAQLQSLDVLLQNCTAEMLKCKSVKQKSEVHSILVCSLMVYLN
jgi:hypothetical protein